MSYVMQGAEDGVRCSSVSWIPLSGPGFTGGFTSSFAVACPSGFSCIQGSPERDRDRPHFCELLQRQLRRIDDTPHIPRLESGQPPAATVNHTAHARATSRPETHRFGSVRSTTKPADGANVTYSIRLLLLCLWDPDARPRVARLHSLSQHEHAEKNSERTSSSNSCTITNPSCAVYNTNKEHLRELRPVNRYYECSGTRRLARACAFTFTFTVRKTCRLVLGILSQGHAMPTAGTRQPGRGLTSADDDAACAEYGWPIRLARACSPQPP